VTPSRGGDTLNGFILANRKLKQGSIVASLTGTNAALANIVFLYAFWGYAYGAAGLVWGAAFWIVGLLIFLLALRRGRLGKLLGAAQPGLGFNEILSGEFSRPRIVTIATAIASGLTFLFLLSLEVGVGSNAAIRLISDTPAASYGFSREALIIGGSVVILVSAYGYIGGFPMVVRTDVWQTVLIIVGLFSALVLCNMLLAQRGTDLLAVVKESLATSTYFEWSWKLAPFVLGSIFSWGFWFLCTMDSWQRALAAEASEERRIRPAAIIAGMVLLVVVSTASSMIGMTIAETWNQATPPAYPVIEFIAAAKNLIPGSEVNGFLVSLVMAGFLAAMASTVDTYMVIVGQSLGGDLVRAKPLSAYVGSADERKILSRIRTVGIITPLVGIGGFALIHVAGEQNNFTLYMLAGSIPLSLLPVSAWVIWGQSRYNVTLEGAWSSAGILVAIPVSMLLNYKLSSHAMETYSEVSFGLLYFMPLLTAAIAGSFLSIDFYVSRAAVASAGAE
jgi:hypothetical protein